MKNCMQCTKPLVHVPGRKEKSFCDVNCRNKYFYAQRKKQVADAAALLMSLPPGYVEIKNVALLTKEGKVKPIPPPPHKKPKDKITKKLEDSVDLHKEAKGDLPDSPQPPRNLEELKKLCPLELSGFDRSNWISIERQKYDI